MQHTQESKFKRFVRRVPMPVLAALFGVLTALAVWVVIDPIQTRAIGNIFDNELQEQLETQARESLSRFDSFVQSYVHTTRLLANHRRMAEYLEPVFWFPSDKAPPRHYPAESPPPWLAPAAIQGLPVPPSHVLLVDLQDRIREVYTLRGLALPGEMAAEVENLTSVETQHAYITRLNGAIYLLIAEPVQDVSYNDMGALVLLVPLDATFLAASQQRSRASETIVALVDGDSQMILAASREQGLLSWAPLEELRENYLVTAQSFFEYGDSPLNLLFATLISKDVVEAMRQRIIAIERRHRLTGATIVGLIFVLLFILVSSRINRLLKRVAALSSRALNIRQPMPQSGNQLLIMEDWIRSFIRAVMQAREEMRARYTAEIKKREALKTAVLDASLDPIITIDQRGHIVDFNPTAEQVFGYRRDEAIGQHLAQLILQPASREDFVNMLYDCLRTENLSRQPVMHALTAHAKDGRAFPVEVAIKPVVMRAGHWLFTTYMRDISERKRQAEEIASLAAFPSESPLPVLRVNQLGVILYANKASAPLLDYWGCRQMQTLPIYWRHLVERVLHEGQDEVEVETREGIFSLLLAPVEDLQYVNIYGRDITAVRRAEEEARHRQNELIHVSRLSTMGEMATGMAHELNQPLSAIINFANGCVRRIRLNIGERQDWILALQKIAEQAERAGQIIKRLRSMVTRQQPVRQKVDLNTLVRDACDLVAWDRQKQQIAIEVQLFPGGVWAWVDPVQIEQVLLNLLRNALDAVRERDVGTRRIRVSTGYTREGYARVHVEDNGCGIAPDALKYVFDPFYSTKKSGMGMGLSISQTIVAEHRGQIWAESKLGVGSRFGIELPSEPLDDLEQRTANHE